MFLNYAQTEPFFFFSWILIITFSICVHEYAHAQVALWKGDDTATRLGHLTLNPLVQMGWTSLFMLLVAGIAWGAVPVNVSRLRGRSASAQVAFAGPAANLLLCLFFGMAAGVAEAMGAVSEITTFMTLGAMSNGVLFLFNMLPIPMFDGWAVLSLFVPAMARIDVRKVSPFSWIAVIVIWTSGMMGWIWEGGALMGAVARRAVLAALGG